MCVCECVQWESCEGPEVLRGERERGGERETEKERMKVRESEREDLELFKGACMVQCVAVCCSVLQCVAVCCSVLQCVAVR